MLRHLKSLLAIAAFMAALSVPPLALAQPADINSAQLQRMPKVGAYPSGSIALNESSGNVAAATATATQPAVAGTMNWLFGFDVYGGGATAASIINCTVTGLAGGTATYNVAVPAGVTGSISPLNIRFPEPLPASAVNVAIVTSCPTFGAGNTNATVNSYGFQSSVFTAP